MWIDGKHTNEYIHLHTLRRVERIKAELNCIVYVIWEHSIRKQYKHNVIMRNFFDSLKLPDVLEIRKGYVGGRLSLHFCRYDCNY